MKYKSFRNGFKTYIQLERNLSENTVNAYLHDVDLLLNFLREEKCSLSLNMILLSDLREFIIYINKSEIAAYTQSRIISGIKAFFNYLELEKIIDINPSELLESPKLTQKLPDILSVDEIESIIENIDLSTPEGQRNRTILEVLYGSGLRVSELINMKISAIKFDDDIILITGKGNKQRLVPMGEMAKKQILIYLEYIRPHIKIKPGFEDFLFLNRRGSSISRQMIFIIIKNQTEKLGIDKKISPHTFRHSFATHLVQGGANLRVVQQLLGHVSITTTEIYTHLNTDDLRKSILKYHPRNTKENNKEEIDET